MNPTDYLKALLETMARPAKTAEEKKAKRWEVDMGLVAFQQAMAMAPTYVPDLVCDAEDEQGLTFNVRS